jgi:TPR repeat protein
MRKSLAQISLCFALSFFFSVDGVKAQDFQKGVAAAKAGDFATALREWGTLAEQGNARAQFKLGKLFLK